MEQQQEYRLEGLTCIDCTKTFEKNVKNISNVEEVEVHFTTSKMKVKGNVSIEQLIEAGKFDDIQVIPLNAEPDNKPINSRNKRIAYASILFAFALAIDLLFSVQPVSILLLYGTVTIACGYKIFLKGFRRLFLFQFDMNVLMSIAVTGAFFIGEWREGALVAYLFAISEWLETYSFDKARNAIRSIMELSPKKATIVRNGVKVLLQVKDIQIGDLMIVKPGEKIAMDGVVVHGSSSVNQATITGESIPVEKGKGDIVFAGTFNEQGNLEVKVSKLTQDTTIAKIIKLVEEAQAKQAPSQAFVDRFAKVYTPIVFVLAIFIAFVPPILFQQDWSQWIYNSLALLVIACPCALVVSTPVAVVSAIGNAAKKGVVVKGGIFLEKLAHVQNIAFDKTGTLTIGKPNVTEMIWYTNNQQEELSIAASIELKTHHPIREAFVSYKQEHGLKDYVVEEFGAIVSAGIHGVVEEKEYYIAKPAYFAEMLNTHIKADVRTLEKKGNTVVVMATSEDVLGLIAIRDTIRESSKQTIKRLRKQKVEKLTMLTGDNKIVGKVISEELGLNNYYSELLPDEKVKQIKQLQKSGITAMVGDGVNDAPALALVDVGIAMGGAGSDSALETADIVLMSDDLDKLPFIINTSRQMLKIIKQNIFFAIAIKLLAIFLIVPGWLTLWLAIFADMGATILVTLNAIRLFKIK